MASNSDLFEPLKFGDITLNHRIVMNPLTRYRAEDDHTPGELAKTYYSQRASVPGTLIFTEATQISPRAGGLGNAPGIWTKEQISAWKEIVDAVHAEKSFIFAQLYAAGRMSQVDLAVEEGYEIVGPSAIAVSDGAHAVPKELDEEEILAFIADFAQAAKNAMEAGFDGVQLHSAYGTLIDQFVQDTANQRTDAWGGSIEKRSKFAIEVVKAVAEAIGIDKVGIRFSPWGTYLSMGMQDTVAQHAYLIKQLASMGLQHLHLVEPRVDGIFDVENSHSNAALIEAWTQATNAPLIISGGYTPGDAQRAVDETYKDKNVAVGFGRPFISNPDFVYRIKHGLPLTPYSRDVFYAVKDPKGYADWPFSEEFPREREGTR